MDVNQGIDQGPYPHLLPLLGQALPLKLLVEGKAQGIPGKGSRWLG